MMKLSDAIILTSMVSFCAIGSAVVAALPKPERPAPQITWQEAKRNECLFLRNNAVIAANRDWDFRHDGHLQPEAALRDSERKAFEARVAFDTCRNELKKKGIDDLDLYDKDGVKWRTE